MTCEYCTGTHYLSDLPDLGACVCCTPEALQCAEATLAKRDATIKAMSEPKTLPEMLDELEGVVSDVRERLAELEREAEEREAAWEPVADVAPALANYLVSINMDAAPVTLPPGPLADLVAAVRACE
jgi:hypothetical protein